MISAAAPFVDHPEAPGLWETMGATVRLLWQRPIALLPIVIVQAISALTWLANVWWAPDGKASHLAVTLSLGFGLTLVAAVGVAALVLVVAQLWQGKLPALAEAFAGVVQHLRPLLALTALFWLLPARNAGGQADAGALVVPVLCDLGRPRLLPDAQVRRQPAVRAVRRLGAHRDAAAQLAFPQRHLLRLFGILLIHTVVTVALSTGLSFGAWLAGWHGAVLIILNHTFAVLLSAFVTVAVTLYYLRLRRLNPREQAPVAVERAPA